METVRKNRIIAIRESLLWGDIKKIATLAGVSREFASMVLNGRATSERVLIITERLIDERGQEKKAEIN